MHLLRVYWEHKVKHHARLHVDQLDRKSYWLICGWKHVFSGIFYFLSSCKVTTFVAKAMSRGGNYVNSSVVKYSMQEKACHALQLSMLLFSSKSCCLVFNLHQWSGDWNQVITTSELWIKAFHTVEDFLIK